MSEHLDNLFDDFELDEIIEKEKTTLLSEGERRNVAILFADIQGFTELSESLDHEIIKNILDGILKVFTRSVENHGGYVDKYTGDQIMALFGAKVASEVDTQRAVYAALDMQSKLEKFNKKLPSSYDLSPEKHTLSVRFGINTGLVTTGKVGKGREGDFTVYGDAVNLASRMESNAPVNRIMLPEKTMQMVEDYFEFEDYGNIQVKGKRDDVSVFLVSKTKDRQDDLDPRFKTPFVGNKKELSQINDLFHKTAQKIGIQEVSPFTTIGIEGNAGQGKSRLVSEFLHVSKHFYIHGATSNIHSRSYHIFVTLIKTCVKITELDSLDIIKKKLDAFYVDVESYLTEKECQEFVESKALIGFLTGIKSDDERLKTKGRELQTHIQIAIRRFIYALTLKTNLSGIPLVIILEDLHWIDDPSKDALINLFEFLGMSRENEDSPEYLFILNYRPEFEMPVEINRNCNFEKITLQPLRENECLEIINYFTDENELSEALNKVLIQGSEGNPFYVEEWMQLIVSKYKHGEDISSELALKDIPDTLGSILLSRVDLLNDNIKELLQKASVLGVEFYVKLLEILNRDLGKTSDINSEIRDLEKLNFIHPAQSLSDFYQFKNVLTREVSYETILKSNRKIMHRMAGEVIESEYHDRVELFLYDLAIHYDLAGQDGKAKKYLDSAGEKAASIYDNKQAIRFYKRYIELLNDNELNIGLDAKSKIADILILTGGWKEAKSIYEDINQQAIKIKDNIREAQFSGGLGNSYYLLGDFKQARNCFKKQLSISDKLSLKEEWSRSMGYIGSLNIDEGHLDDAMACFKEQEEYFIAENEDMQLSHVYGNMGTVNLRQGKMNDAKAFYEKQLKRCKKYNLKHQGAKALGNLGIINIITGQFSDAIKVFQNVLDENIEIGDQQAIAKTFGNLGLGHKELKEFETALTYFNRMLDLAGKIGDQHTIANAYSSIGLIYKHQGLYNKAVIFFKKNMTIMEKLRLTAGFMNTYANMAEIYVDMGKLKEAREYFDKSLIICTDQEDSHTEAMLLERVAEIDYMENNKFSSRGNLDDE